MPCTIACYELTAASYNDDVAADPRVDALRAKMTVSENPQFTLEYFDPEKRAIGNAIQVFYKDGGQSERVHIDYPIGHRRRRSEGMPELEAKFRSALAGFYCGRQAEAIEQAFSDADVLDYMQVNRYMGLFSK